MHPLLQRHWFLLLLAGVLAGGMWLGPNLADTLRTFPRGWLVATVMFITALPMSFTQLTSAARRFGSVGLALSLSMVIAPPLAWVIGRLLPESMAVGLVVAAAVPCTLASAAVWTRRGGGNDAVALLVTLVTNLACFAVLPGWLWLLLRSEVQVDATGLSLRLLLLVVLPVVAAQSLRLYPQVALSVGTWKRQLSLAAQLGVLAMVFFGAVSAGQTVAGIDSAADAHRWLAMVAAVGGLHLALFAAGWWAGGVLVGTRPEQLAIAIAGSQKTLMIGLDVALGFGGLAVLPMVAYHIFQLVADTLLVDRLRPLVTAETDAE